MAQMERTESRLIQFIDSAGGTLRGRVREVEDAAKLATRYGSGLQVSCASIEQLGRLARAMSRHGRVDYRGCRFSIERPVDAALLECDLLVMSLRRSRILGRGIETWKREAIEASRAPVLLLPPGRARMAPFDSMLVPMSGEARINSALTWAIRFGSRRGIPVDIVHVMEPGMLSQVNDELHHEYPELIERFLSEASPYSTASEKRIIRGFYPRGNGDPVTQIDRMIRRNRAALLVLEWNGSLEAGRARIIKELMRKAASPILLVRHEEEGSARLRVGRDFPAA